MFSLRTYIVIAVIILTLALTFDEDTYYPSILGPVLDLFFERDLYDDDLSGSGFTLFIDNNWKTICRFYQFLVTMFWSLLILFALPVVAMICHIAYDQSQQIKEREACYRYMEAHDGEIPPWRVKTQPASDPKYDKRYLPVGEDGGTIFVYGAGYGPGGYERVYNGDIEGVIWRHGLRAGRRQFV